MEFKRISKEKNREYIDFKDLYYLAFPLEERRPWKILTGLINREKIKAYSIYDGDFIGLIVYTTFKDILWIDYLATNPKIRSKGYGKRILDKLSEDNPGYRIFVEVETPDKDHKDYEDQLKRIAFYEKNGFEHSEVRAEVFGCDFTLYSKGGKVSYEDYENITIESYGKVFFKLARYKEIK